MWHMGFVAHQYVGSFWTMDHICVPCIARWILIHWTTREVPQTFSPFATSSLSPLANKHAQISSILKKDLSLAQALSLTLCSFWFWFFSHIWGILFSNYLGILASHSYIPSTMKSWFSPPVHHTFASTLQKLLWKWQPVTSILSNLSILSSGFFLVFSFLSENDWDSVLSKIAYPWFPWYYSLLGLPLLCYHLLYEYICFSCICSLNINVLRGFILSLFFCITAFLTINSFQVISCELMI